MTAIMTIEREGYTSVARIWVAAPFLRMEVLGGRIAHTMILDYRQERAWSLIPQQRLYQTFALAQLDQSVPHFFDPAIILEKELLKEEAIDGHPSRCFRLKAVSRSGREYSGTLWESQLISGFPLQWQDDLLDLRVRWQEIAETAMSTDCFSLPSDYQALVSR